MQVCSFHKVIILNCVFESCFDLKIELFKRLLLIELCQTSYVFYNCPQRSGLAAVWAFEFRLPVTEVDNCNIADVLFISQIYNVLLELKHNNELMFMFISSAQIAANLMLGVRQVFLCPFNIICSNSFVC